MLQGVVRGRWLIVNSHESDAFRRRRIMRFVGRRPVTAGGSGWDAAASTTNGGQKAAELRRWTEATTSMQVDDGGDRGRARSGGPHQTTLRLAEGRPILPQAIDARALDELAVNEPTSLAARSSGRRPAPAEKLTLIRARCGPAVAWGADGECSGGRGQRRRAAWSRRGRTAALRRMRTSCCPSPPASATRCVVHLLPRLDL
jgi:hypothetical protein